MMSEAQRGSAEGRARLEQFLKRHFGENICDPNLGPIAVRSAADHSIAERFTVDTEKAIQTGNPADGLMSGAIIVPKDGSPVHWAPTALPIADYLEQVAKGERWWSNAGADPVVKVHYFARLQPGATREDPSGIVRRRTTDSETIDEAFTRNVKWEPTDYFIRYKAGHQDDDHVEITAKEAADFVRTVRAELMH